MRRPACSIRCTFSTCTPCRSGLVHLLPLFPVQADFSVERDEYNKNVRAAFERMRDFQSAHYLLNRYGGLAILDAGARRGPKRRTRAQDRRLSCARRNRGLRRRGVHHRRLADVVHRPRRIAGVLRSGRGSHLAGSPEERAGVASWGSSDRRSTSSVRTRTICAMSAESAALEASRRNVTGRRVLGRRRHLEQ